MSTDLRALVRASDIVTRARMAGKGNTPPLWIPSATYVPKAQKEADLQTEMKRALLEVALCDPTATESAPEGVDRAVAAYRAASGRLETALASRRLETSTWSQTMLAQLGDVSGEHAALTAGAAVGVDGIFEAHDRLMYDYAQAYGREPEYTLFEAKPKAQAAVRGGGRVARVVKVGGRRDVYDEAIRLKRARATRSVPAA